MRDLTPEILRGCLRYDTSTGKFTWKRRTGGRATTGVAAGTVTARGYLEIGLGRKIYKAHRLAWLYVYGVWPIGEIDHIDGDKLNNAIRNLRDVPRRANQQNLRRALGARTNGLLGATHHKATGKWRSRLWVDGRNISLGLYETAEEAHKAYIEAKRKHHEGCTL
ncbi:hypothetical protein CAL18_12575 [Bordetella genomosp. 7]|uniref:HNH endonuclease n=1 Tax=Bordetella genomosp. 7 TaxID=1416805 RepID=UPI000B9ECBC1|nr:HNH endonuclease [Bordetella genomosp. 7]OZI21752.1 hypothetical protein CAL18_12575 [Bordetella genomosp. 7]